MMTSAEGGTGFLHTITKLAAWRGCARVEELEGDAKPMERWEEKENEWAKHWQCDSEAHSMEDMPWRSAELRSLLSFRRMWCHTRAFVLCLASTRRSSHRRRLAMYGCRWQRSPRLHDCPSVCSHDCARSPTRNRHAVCRCSSTPLSAASVMTRCPHHVRGDPGRGCTSQIVLKMFNVLTGTLLSRQ